MGYNPYRKANGEFATKEEAGAQVENDYAAAVASGDATQIAEIEEFVVNNMSASPLGQKVLEKKFGTTAKRRKKVPTFEEPRVVPIEGYGNMGWRGSKRPTSGSYFSNKDAAKKIRNDLKDATAAGFLPKGLKYSVTSPNDSVEIRMTGLGRDRDIYEYDFRYTPVRKKLKPEFQEIVDKVEAIHKSYNYDGSNVAVDYFDRGYYGGVKVLSEVDLTSKEYEKSKIKLSKIVEEYGENSEEFAEGRKDFFAKRREYLIAAETSNLAYSAVKQGHQPDWEMIDELAARRVDMKSDRL